jgi:hypothetical protein
MSTGCLDRSKMLATGGYLVTTSGCGRAGKRRGLRRTSNISETRFAGRSNQTNRTVELKATGLGFIMLPMTNHDRLFKELISTFFLEFLELFSPRVRAYVDAGSIEFLDKELFIDISSGGRLEPDLVAKARLKGQHSFFIIHVETQAQAQKEFGRRLFRYFSRLHDKYNLPVYPIVLFSFRSPRKLQPDVYRVQFPNKTVMEFRFDVIQLNRLNWRDFVKKRNPVAAALMAKMGIAPKDRPRVKLECLRLLATLKLDKARMKLISGFIDTYLQLNGAELKKFESEVKTLQFEETEEVMEIVTSWMKDGIKQGRKEGREAGIKEAVMEILSARFNAVPPAVKKKLKTIEDGKQLKSLLRQAGTVQTLKEFERRMSESK